MSLSLSKIKSTRFLSSARPNLDAFDVKCLRPSVLKAEYAVRGAITAKAEEISQRMKSGEVFPFDDFIRCNIGNPFAVGKTHLSFPRQMIAATEYPEILKENVLPLEVVERSREFLAKCPGGLGAYSHSQGIELVRKHVAEFIEKRDGIPSDPRDIYLTTGASLAVRTILEMIIANTRCGVMIPFPTYPLYTAETVLHDGRVAPYYLNEDHGWDLELDELHRSLKIAHDNGTDVRVLVVINPGNPTGNVMTEKTMKDVINFCEAHHILLIADEVYQENTYNPKRPFISFKSLAVKMDSAIQVISLHSVSKGFLGECGHRGGYMEIYNISDASREQIYKMMSINLSPNCVGQLIVDVMCKPPESDECKKIWNSERNQEIHSLEIKSRYLTKVLDNLPGMKCQPADGSMYLFPKLELPPKAIEEASKMMIKGKPAAPDMFWAMNLLLETGIVVVPGSGFGQREGTNHFRITFLPVEDQMKEVVDRLTDFQKRFIEKYQ